MKKASKITLLVLLILVMKELWRLKQKTKEGYGSDRSCRCGHRYWS